MILFYIHNSILNTTGSYTAPCSLFYFSPDLLQKFYSKQLEEISYFDFSPVIMLFGNRQPLLPVPLLYEWFLDHHPSTETISNKASVNNGWINRRAICICQVLHFLSDVTFTYYSSFLCLHFSSATSSFVLSLYSCTQLFKGHTAHSVVI